MAQLTLKEKKAIQQYRKILPRSVKTAVVSFREGGYGAKILDLPGAITQASTFAELISMVNDCVFTYLEIPKKFLPFMGSYFPPIKLAQALSIWPRPRRVNTIEFAMATDNRN